MDSVNYAVWVALLLTAVPFAKQFNRWTKADTSALDEATRRLENEQADKPEAQLTSVNLAAQIVSALAVCFISTRIADLLPVSAFFSRTTWVVVIATLSGVLAAGKAQSIFAASEKTATATLYFLVALIASRANFSELTSAPLYIASGFCILGFHGIIMTIIARIAHLDLFTCGVASLANVGGVASAPILAASYSSTLIPVGILMAMLGYVTGTGGGLLVGKILSLLAPS
jgi:uncharacterized membrane protein